MFKLLLLVIVVGGLVLLLTRQAEAQEALPLEKAVFKGKDGKELPYRILRPIELKSNQRYPLVLFLHGAGERGTDNTKQMVHGVPMFASEENRKKYPCFLIAPQCPAGKRWVEVDWSADSHETPKTPSEPMALLMELLDQGLKDLPIDSNRIYVTGLSMGGYGAWDLAIRRPDRVAGLVVVCGGGDEKAAEKVKHVPVWMFHGAKDTAVKPERSRNMRKALETAGGKPRYTEYPEVGHAAWTPAYRDAEMMKWLFEQKRSDSK